MSVSDQNKPAEKNALWETIVVLFQAFLLAAVIRTVLLQPFTIPSGSMMPTLLVGDYLLVNKFAYGYSRYSLPAYNPGWFTGRIMVPGLSGTPTRGDVIVFRLPSDPSIDYIKRVIGLPGDRIALDGGRLYLNGERVARKDRGTYAYRDANGIVIRVHRYDEVLPGGRTHAIIERTDSGMADTMAEMTVPEGQLFVLGDNRDNSLDSRFEETGLVPVENLQGRADLVGWSFYTCKAEQGLACAKARFLTMLQ